MSANGGVRAGRSQDAEFLDLIGDIYEVALAPQDLPHLLSRVVRLVGALWAPTSVVPLDGGAPMSLHNVDGDPDHLALFNSRYVSPEHNPATPLLMAARPGEIVQRERYFSDADWQGREIYQQIYRPIGAEASLGVVLLKTRQHFVPLGLMRPRSFGPYDAEDLGRLRRVMPHLMRMMQILLRLNDLAGRTAADAALWDRLPFGVALLDEAGRSVWTNRAVETILSQADGLLCRNGFLRSSDPTEHARLEHLIAGAAATGRASGVGNGGAIALSRSSGGRPLSVLVAPFRVDRGPVIASRRAAVVVFVNDPERHQAPPLQQLAAFYRLTAREAALLGLLLEGIDLREAADRMGIGMNTARTHLRQAFDKTGTHRQAELVSLILRSTVALEERHGAS